MMKKWLLLKYIPISRLECKNHTLFMTKMTEISLNIDNKRKLARLITQHRDIFFPIFRKARPSFLRVLQRMTKVFNITSLKYGKYNITNEKINNNKRLIDRAR